MWHSCSRYPLSLHFENKEPIIRLLFNRLLGLARNCGPLVVYAQKTRIVFQVQVRFGGVVTRKRSLDVSLWLKRKAQHPCLRRIETYSPRDYGHFFRFTEASQMDTEFADLVRESYSIGCREHLKTAARAPERLRATQRDEPRRRIEPRRR
jgi:hypothetical protein